MKIAAVMGSYRKGRTIDTLMAHAIEGARSVMPDCTVDMIRLIDTHIEYCRNCMLCKKDAPDKPIATCVIDDDMQAMYPILSEADGFIFGTPVNMAHETALMKTFIERSCYVLSRPGRFPLNGVPTPRCDRERRAIAILSSGIVPPMLRWFCDEATGLIRDFCRNILNAKLVGSLYAGAVAKRGVDYYALRAVDLGRKLIP